MAPSKRRCDVSGGNHLWGRVLMHQLVMVRTLSGGEPGILLREPKICTRAVRGWIQKHAARIHETRVIGDQGKVQSEIMHVVCV